MPLYHFKCPSCDSVEEIYLPLPMVRVDDHVVTCSECDVAMERVPTSGSFKVEGYNAGNGYAKTAP